MWVKFMLLQNLLLLILYKKKLFFLFEETKPKMKTKPIFFYKANVYHRISEVAKLLKLGLFSAMQIFYLCVGGWGGNRTV